MEDNKKPNNEKISDILEKADESDTVRQELAELREQKERMLEKQASNQKSRDTNRNKYINGNVDFVEKDGNNSAIVHIEYPLNGDIKSTEFRMKIPENPEDYSIENKYVRLRKTANVDPDQSLMGRNIPLQIDENDNVHLDLPNKPTLLNRTIHKTKRTVHSFKITHIIQNIKDSTTIRAGSQLTTGLTMVTLSLILLFHALVSVGPKFVVDLGFSTITLGSVLMGLLYAEYNSTKSIKISSFIAMLGGSALVSFVLFSDIPLVWISDQYTVYQNIMTVIQYGFAVYLISCSLMHLESGFKPANNKIHNKISEVKQKIQQKQGVEFVEN